MLWSWQPRLRYPGKPQAARHSSYLLCAMPFGADAKKEMEKDKKHQRHWTCEWCLYPPCAGCGSKRTWAKKREEIQFQLWFCRK